MRLKTLAAGLALIAAGCASTPQRSDTSVRQYRGTTDHYFVEATETFTNGFCEERVIALKARPMSHPYRIVQQVRIRDMHCDGQWSMTDTYFRNSNDERKASSDFPTFWGDVNYAFETARQQTISRARRER